MSQQCWVVVWFLFRAVFAISMLVLWMCGSLFEWNGFGFRFWDYMMLHGAFDAKFLCDGTFCYLVIFQLSNWVVDQEYKVPRDALVLMLASALSFLSTICHRLKGKSYNV